MQFATLPFDLKRSFTKTRFRCNFCSDKSVQTWFGLFQKPIRYGTFHFQQRSGAVLFRSRNCFESSIPCVNRSPILFSFCDAPFHYPVQCEHSLILCCFFFFWNDQISSRGQGIVLKFWQCVLLDQSHLMFTTETKHLMFTTQFHESYRFSVIIKQSSSQGPVDVKFHMGHWFHSFWFITPKWEIGFSQNFQQVSAQAWRRCLQNWV